MMAMNKTAEKKRILAAPCGLYCGACSIYVAGKRGDAEFLETAATGLADYLGHPVEPKELACEGCLSDVLAVHCRECQLRDCALSKKITHCAQCVDFPCPQITEFNNDEFAHHSEVIESIRRQQQIGLDAWIEEQQVRWRCAVCGHVSGWYAVQCYNCDNVLNKHF